MQRSGAYRCRVADRQCNSFISCPMRVQLPPLQPFMLRVAQKVRAPGCGLGGRRFETGHAPHGLLAQQVERQTEDLRVPSSIPGESTIYGRMPESGQKGQTVNLLAMPALVQIQLLPPIELNPVVSTLQGSCQ